jgi:hypothetical protein
MAKRLTHLERAIQDLDDKIASFQLARQHLVDQQAQIVSRRQEAQPITRLPNGSFQRGAALEVK